MSKYNKYREYDIIYSLGRDCACATYLKRTGLRATSGPFDWLTNAGFESRFQLILNDFKDFLNQEDLVAMERPAQFPPDKNNDYYQNTRNGLYFWHDFPADQSFNDAYPVILQKYQRRIDRFYENIKTRKRVLLIWFSQVHNTPDETVLKYCSAVCQKFNRQIDFLIIEHTEGLQKVQTRMLAPNIRRCNCHAQKKNDDGTPLTQGNQELLQPVFRQYRLCLPLSQKMKNLLLKTIVRLVCIFIPVKKWRRAFRKKLMP